MRELEQSVRQRGRSAATRPNVGDLLRNRIMTGEFVPGQRLIETELASRFGASRGAVRAAIIDLAGEGLIERVPNRGATVRVVSLAEAIEITECRMVLEGLCAAKAAAGLTQIEADELTGLITAMRSAVDGGDLLGYSTLNHHLHLRIQLISKQATAMRAVERLRGQFVRHQFRLALQPGRARASLAEHERIAAAIVAHDPGRAEHEMRAHLGSVITALREAAEPGARR